LLDATVMRERYAPIGVDRRDQPLVDRRKPLLRDLPLLGAKHFQLGARPEVEVDQLGGAGTKALGHILSGNDQVGATLVRAANDDVAVRVPGVEVIDRNPVELRAEVVLGLCHHPADKRLKVIILGTILGGDDEAKLVPITRPAFKERASVGASIAGTVQRAALAIAGRAIPLQIAKVRDGTGGTLASQLDDARLDDHPAPSRMGKAVAAAQHAADASAAPDALAGEARPAAHGSGGAPRQVSRPLQLARIGALALDAAQAGEEVFVGHDHHPKISLEVIMMRGARWPPSRASNESRARAADYRDFGARNLAVRQYTAVPPPMPPSKTTCRRHFWASTEAQLSSCHPHFFPKLLPTAPIFTLF
jgi:hypothetical protein